MRKYFSAFVIILFPGFIKKILLKVMGHKIHWRAKIGFSLVICEKLELSKYAKISHFNFIKCDSLVLQEKALIINFNFIKGPFDVFLKSGAAINKSNKIVRAYPPITNGPAKLLLGQMTFITVGHTLDLTDTIIFGDYSILAGKGSQLWTHGFYHYPDGPKRIRIDGAIVIGNNVYVGSACVFSCGVTVNDSITIGAASVISKDLIKKGLYVNQKLRYLNLDIETIIKDKTLAHNISKDCPVYKKK